MSHLSPLEQFFRFDRLESSVQLMRGRAVLLIGLAFILTQLVNIFFMTITYGAWTIDHNISLSGIVSISLVMLVLRVSHNFVVFAGLYSVMLLTGIGMSALNADTGINSALLPLVVCGAILNGFIGGWRLIIFYGITALAFTWALHGISIDALGDAITHEPQEKNRLFQRAMQCSLALFLASACAGLIVSTMDRVFEQRDQLLAELERTHQEKVDFLAYMSSRMSEPVRGVNAALAKMEKGQASAEQRQLRSFAAQKARRLLYLVADSLTLSSIDRQQLVMAQDPMNLRQTIKAQMARYEAMALNKGVHLGTTYAAHLPEIYKGDEKRLGQVVRNLIAHALWQTDEGSVHIYVDGRLKGASEVMLTLSVKDTGQGMSEADMEAAFRRYNPSIAKLATAHGGTGMELAICQELVGLMNGTLVLESQKGMGSNFEITMALSTVASLSVDLDDDQKAPRQTTETNHIAA